MTAENPKFFGKQSQIDKLCHPNDLVAQETRMGRFPKPLESSHLLQGRQPKRKTILERDA